jgi:uncharacterized protein (DUF58 family)
VRRVGRVAALGVVLCLLAAAFNVRALYVAGVTLALLAFASAAGVLLAARVARIVREPAAASVEEGAALELSVRVSGRPPAFAGGELRTWPGAESLPLRRLPPGPLQFEVRPTRRGQHEIEPSRLRFRDPFGLCVRTLRSQPCRVLVLPRVERIEGERLTTLGGLRSGIEGRGGWAEGADVDGLRPYRAGASAARIHWPAVARTGTLLERRPASEGEGRPLLVLDARSPASEQALDMAVRAAASLCVALARLGGCSLLLPEAPRPEPVDRKLALWPALHQRLALVREGAAPVSGVARAATVIWISAAAPARRDCEYTVSPIASDERPVVLAVAGCALQATAGADAARAA